MKDDERTPPQGPAESGGSVSFDQDAFVTPSLRDTDFPPALRSTLERKLREEGESGGSTLSEPDFREALRKAAQHKQCD